MRIDVKDMIAKKDLKSSRYYIGVCRNSHVAKWNSKEECFHYMRTKFSKTFCETIKHPEDDDGWDLFIPYELIPSPQSKEWKYSNQSSGKLIPKN